MDFTSVLEVFVWILLVKLRCCIFAGGRPRVLSKFPLKNSQKSKSPLGEWISPMFWMFFLDFAYEIALLHFCRREAQGTQQTSFGKSLKPSNLNWVDGFPLCFGGFFWILLTKLRYCIFAGGRPRVLSKFPSKNQQNSDSELGRWISPMFWRFCLDFAYKNALLHFCRREAQGTQQISIGQMDFPYVLEVFSGFYL